VSQRRRVDRERIRRFFRSLAERFRRPARIYLVGGTTVVFQGLREQPLDIDVVLEVSPADHGDLIRAIRELEDALSMNVEEASPGDFIPLPAGFQERHLFVERFGDLEVLHFDPYSTALSKIERGRTQDFEDVLALLKARKLEWERLVKCFAEILPKMGEHSLKQDPVEFQENFGALEGMWKGEPQSW